MTEEPEDSSLEIVERIPEPVAPVNAPFMNLRQVRACAYLLLGTLQVRSSAESSGKDPRAEEIMARVFIKKRLRDLPVTDDRNSRDYVLRALYTLLDLNFVAIFNKIGQVPGELAFLSGIQNEPDFDEIELQFIWACDYLFQSGQLEHAWRGDFRVPKTPEFELPQLDDISEEVERTFMEESEREIRRELEGFLSLEGPQ